METGDSSADEVAIFSVRGDGKDTGSVGLITVGLTSVLVTGGLITAGGLVEAPTHTELLASIRGCAKLGEYRKAEPFRRTSQLLIAKHCVISESPWACHFGIAESANSGIRRNGGIGRRVV